MAIIIGGKEWLDNSARRRREADAHRREIARQAAAQRAERAAAEGERQRAWTEEQRPRRVARQARAVADAEAAGIRLDLAPIPIEPPSDFSPLGPEPIVPIAVADPERMRQFLTGGRHENRPSAVVSKTVTVPAEDAADLIPGRT